MAKEIEFAEIQEKQAALMKLAERIQSMTDGNAIAAMAPELAARGKELEGLATEFEKQQLARHAPANGTTEVVLTAAQQTRIHEKTGVTLGSVVIADAAGIVAATMPQTDPRIIEHHALVAAQRQKHAEEAKALLKSQVDALFAFLEKQSPALADKVAELKRDPNFLDGTLQKK